MHTQLEATYTAFIINSTSTSINSGYHLGKWQGAKHLDKYNITLCHNYHL